MHSNTDPGMIQVQMFMNQLECIHQTGCPANQMVKI